MPSSTLRILGLLLLLTGAHAGIVRRTTCESTGLTGTLAFKATDASGEIQYLPASLNEADHLAFEVNPTEPLVVDWQLCPVPDGDLEGRFYIPSREACLGVRNQANAEGPYWTGLIDCTHDSWNNWDSRNWDRKWLQRDGEFFYLGRTDAEGTTPQGGCGLLGYKSNDTGIPVLTDGEVEITCDSPQRAFAIIM